MELRVSNRPVATKKTVRAMIGAFILRCGTYLSPWFGAGQTKQGKSAESSPPKCNAERANITGWSADAYSLPSRPRCEEAR